MQVFGLPGHVIRNGRYASRLIDAETQNIAAAIRHDAVLRWRQAIAKGLTAQAAAAIVGVPRSTLYRWEKRPQPKSRRPHWPRRPAWSSAVVQAVEEFRADNPMWGKRKLAVLVRRQDFAVSVSTVGRILNSLVARGAVSPVPMLRGKPGGRRFRIFGSKNYARRLPKGLKPIHPGEIVQVDTMFISPAPGQSHKHFTAYNPVAKWTVAGVASRATANLASNFDKLIADMPFKVTGIQVDGGSEFMADFERACQDKDLRLYVLPPKRPQLNGAVERCNGAWRYEFYAVYDLPPRLDQLQPLVDAFAHRFNHHRPHDALDGKTPAEYLHALSSAISPSQTPPSHMS
jgi:transposase InsO family protein